MVERLKIIVWVKEQTFEVETDWEGVKHAEQLALKKVREIAGGDDVDWDFKVVDDVGSLIDWESMAE